MADDTQTADYVLDDQAGYLLRLVNQRHTAIFQAAMAHDLTPTQFSMLIRLSEVGSGSQNQLGRLTAMDVATAKGVVDRLHAKGLVTFAADASDARRRLIALSDAGQAIVSELKAIGKAITEETLEPLDKAERAVFVDLLRKLS